MEIKNQRMYKSAGRYSVPKKKKRVSYFHELSQQQLPKPPKQTLKATWQNPQGNACKKIIPPNRCFCTHQFSHHESPKTMGPSFCQVPGCKCKCYQYVPFYDLKCMCRHSYKEHDPVTRMCRMCARCLGFVSNWGCRCGGRFEMHETVFQVVRERGDGEREGERESRGKEGKVLNSQRINSRNEADFSLQIDESDKENLNTASILLPKPLDARSYQLSKYIPELTQYIQNESKLEQHKRKQIERINSKYGNNNYERQVQVQERNQLMGSRICRPQLARSVTPLELIIRPHLYTNVRLEEFLEMEMRRCQGKSVNGGMGS